jgi:hypothetical protein
MFSLATWSAAGLHLWMVVIGVGGFEDVDGQGDDR